MIDTYKTDKEREDDYRRMFATYEAMSYEEWTNEVRKIWAYTYHEDSPLWESTRLESGEQPEWLEKELLDMENTDKSHLLGDIERWLNENEPEVWLRLRPLILEWTKEILWGGSDDWMEYDCYTRGFEEYKPTHGWWWNGEE